MALYETRRVGAATANARLLGQSRRRRWLGAGASGFIAIVAAVPVQAQDRKDVVTRGILSVERGCPIAPPATDAQTLVASEKGIGLILGTLFAGVAGDLASSALNGIGSALESASQEKGYVAEGVGTFTFYAVKDKGAAPKAWRTEPDFSSLARKDGATGDVPANEIGEKVARCFVLGVDGDATKSDAKDLTASNLTGAFAGLTNARALNAAPRLQGMGFTKVPALYVEMELVTASDGMVLQPVLIRYGEPYGGAPKELKNAELAVSFATPGGADATDIGTLFALARVPLPKLAPSGNRTKESSTTWDRDKLARYRSVVVPVRPLTGSPEDALKVRSGAEAAWETKNKEVEQLVELRDKAQRARNQATKPADVVTTQNALDDANKALTQAQAERQKLREKAAGFAPTVAGSTNVKARLVVIKDANEFGLALAKALKGQSEALGKSVTSALTPKPEWTGDDTAFVGAEADVRAAQRALDEAIAKGEADKLPGLQDGVLKAKAKANEAAVAAGRSPPYTISF